MSHETDVSAVWKFVTNWKSVDKNNWLKFSFRLINRNIVPLRNSVVAVLSAFYQSFWHSASYIFSSPLFLCLSFSILPSHCQRGMKTICSPPALLTSGVGLRKTETHSLFTVKCYRGRRKSYKGAAGGEKKWRLEKKFGDLLQLDCLFLECTVLPSQVDDYVTKPE